MSLPAISQLLVDTLQGLPQLDGRFSNIKLVNYDAVAGRRGVCSLVFRADDDVEGRTVALKFFDPALSMDQYRLDAFGRECEILQSLMSAERCLQLEKATTAYALAIPGSGTPPIPVPCQYFAVRWLNDDVDEYFLNSTVDPTEKVATFNQMILAVEALHRRHIFHRDLKIDNFRILEDGEERRVVAIDLGTAARFESKYIQLNYGAAVGAPAYASPEARASLAGNRLLAPFTDVYALGCLLYELFNPDYFFRALYTANPHYDARLAAMSQIVTDRVSEAKQLEQWHEALTRFGSGITPVPIDSAGNSVPLAVLPLLNELLLRLTHFDYRNRPHLGWVRARLRVVLKVLRNESLAQSRRKQVLEMRRRRVEKARQKEALFLRVKQLRGF